ncbi:MAG: cobyrinate a,c-diamide synthase [Desulfocapsaceae bacterium]
MSKSTARAIVVAGLSGGSGKSVISVGLTAAWVKAGRTVAPFKKGPDYIDAGWLQSGAGRPCYNLDPYLFSAEAVRRSFCTRAAGADLAIVEGNRGLFDGVTARGGYSTAELALQLDLPVLLVINCTKMTRTVAALVQGCIAFEPDLKLAGVVLNQVATGRQQKIITEAIHYYTDVKVLGAVPRLKTDIFPMRHLGMIPYQEYDGTGEALDMLAGLVNEHIDLDGVEAVMSTVPASPASKASEISSDNLSSGIKIGVIQDTAFQFYYPENLEALQQHGAELVSINALEDERLPELDGLYIGGGFPETSAARLAENGSFRHSVKAAADSGLPIYAECGGLIYLGREIIIDECRYPLVGVFDVVFGMSNKPQAHGYSIFTAERDNPFYPAGFTTRGHEFRYSTVVEWHGERQDLTLKMDRGTGFLHGYDGLVSGNVLALYTHLHAEGSPEWAHYFTRKSLQYKRDRGSGC